MLIYTNHTCEKMLTDTNHRGNMNDNHRYHFTLVRMAVIRKTVRIDREDREVPLDTAGRDIN